MSAQNRALRVQEANFKALVDYARKLRAGLDMFGLDVPNVVGFHQRVSVTAQEVCRAQTMRPPAKLFSKLLRKLELPEDDAHRLTDVVTALTTPSPIDSYAFLPVPLRFQSTPRQGKSVAVWWSTWQKARSAHGLPVEVLGIDESHAVDAIAYGLGGKHGQS